ncbi:ATP-binding protein [Caballeronia sp. HLA56]
MLSIKDDGRGAQPNAARAANTFGLLGMGERVRQMNGVVTFRGAPGDGFRIDVEIPMSAFVAVADRSDARMPALTRSNPLRQESSGRIPQIDSNESRATRLGAKSTDHVASLAV